uniref:Uncharacterized protein n=1 Tax=Tetranychus urticae TaxID=32264 RepID=A0A158P4D7_TETUR
MIAVADITIVAKSRSGELRSAGEHKDDDGVKLLCSNGDEPL